MSYSQFTLAQVKTDFGLTIEEDRSLFNNPPELSPSSLLQQILQRYLPLALANNSEKARSEFILAPILVDVCDRCDRPISLFSGKEFNVDSARGLTGFCDKDEYYIKELAKILGILSFPFRE